MARSTLPAFDPLAELGIVGREPEPTEPRRSPREDRPQAAPEAEQVAVGVSAVAAVERPPRAESADVLAVPPSGPRMRFSRPRSPQKPRTQPGDAPGLTAAVSSDTAPARAQKARISGRVAVEVAEEVRDCVVWHGHAMTLDSFTEAALREHLKRLRRELGLGERFPARDREPKQGRRVA